MFSVFFNTPPVVMLGVCRKNGHHVNSHAFRRQERKHILLKHTYTPTPTHTAQCLVSGFDGVCSFSSLRTNYPFYCLGSIFPSGTRAARRGRASSPLKWRRHPSLPMTKHTGPRSNATLCVVRSEGTRRTWFALSHQSMRAVLTSTPKKHWNNTTHTHTQTHARTHTRTQKPGWTLCLIGTVCRVVPTSQCEGSCFVFFQIGLAICSPCGAAQSSLRLHNFSVLIKRGGGLCREHVRDRL